MRILYIVTQQDLGGAQKYTLQLAKAFKGSIAAGPEGSHLEKEAQKAGIPFTMLPHLRRSINPWRDMRGLWEIYQLIRKQQPELVHANSSKAGVIASVAAWLARVPIIFTAHGFQYMEPMPAWKKSFFWLCELFCRPLRAFVITVSEADRKQVLKAGVIHTKYSQTIYHGIPIPGFLPKAAAREQLGLAPESFIIGTIANHYHTKGLDVLLKAFAKLPAGLPHGTLVIIGDGPERQSLEDLAGRLNITTRAHFIGQKQNAAQYLKAFDIFVLPSRKEGFPYTLLEALTAGIPIVTTDVGGNTEAVGDAALVIAPDSPDILSYNIEKLAQDPLLRQTLADAALRQSKKFSESSSIQQTEQLYRKILGA